MYRYGISPRFPQPFYAPEDAGSGAGASPSGGTGAPSGSGAPPGGTPSGGAPGSTPASGAPGAQSQGGGQGNPPGANGSPANNGPVDYARFAEVNGKYDAVRWAEGLDPVSAQEAQNLWNWFDSDPDGAYTYLTNVMERAGRLPGQGRGGRGGQQGQGQGQQQRQDYPAAPDGRPLPDIPLEGGGALYSAAQAERLVEFRAQALEERLSRIEGNTVQQETRQAARGVLQDAETNWPGFKDNLPAIHAEMNRDRRLSLDGAYRRIVVQGGKLREFHRTELANEMRQGAGAGQGSGNPANNGAPHSSELSKLPLKELLRREMQRVGIGR